MSMRTTSAKDRVLVLRQAQRLGCSGTHTDPNGFLKPCSSSAELERLTGRKPGSTPRQMRGQNRLRRQWENLGENGIVSIDTLSGGGLVSGMFVKADLMYQPRDNDPDVFTDIESARMRSRQLGCVGVSRRISKTGKTVWMPCTNMSDFNRLTGSTSLGRRHQRESIRKIIRDEIRQVNRRQRKKSLHNELNTVETDTPVEFKALGERISARPRPGQIFQDISGVLDGDGDGIVFDSDMRKRRPIIPVGVVGASGQVATLTPSQQARVSRQIAKESQRPRQTLTDRRSRALAKMQSSARLNISEPGTYFSNKTPSEIITESTPVNPQELMASIANNPYSRINAEAAFRAIMAAEPDWGASLRLRNELLSELGNESLQNGMKRLIGKFGIPAIIPTSKIPQKPMFKKGDWGLISGMYDSRGFIGINKNAIMGTGNAVYEGITRARRMSIVRHEAGHAFSDMAAAMSPDLVDRRLRYFAEDIAREMRRLSKAAKREKRYRKTYMGDLAVSLWGTRDEFDSARKISDYATFSRDEYFAETIDALFDPETSFGKNRVDSMALAHAAETLGMSVSDMMDLAGREREIPNLFDLLDSGSAPTRGSKSTTKLSSNDQQLVDLVSANPGLLEEVPIQLFGEFSPSTLSAARLQRERAAQLFGITDAGSSGMPGFGGQIAINEMLNGINDEARQLREPSAYFVLGPSGSGKTSSITSGVLDVPSPDRSLHIGIDEIKPRLSGYDDGIGSAIIHASARHTQRKAASAGINESVDVVIDDYGNNSELLRSFASANYSIVGNMMYVPERELERRITEREKETGPILGATFARLTNRNYVNNVKQQIMSGLFNRMNIWDNSRSGGPKLVAGHDDSGLFKIRNAKKFKQIFGTDSDAVEEMLAISSLNAPFRQKKPTVSVLKSFNNSDSFRIRGFFGEKKLSRNDMQDIPTAGIDIQGQELVDDADFTNLDMSFSNLDSVNGIAVQFSGSSLLGASMRKAYLPAIKTLSPGGGAATDMRFVDMSQGNFAGSDFGGADMTGATLVGSNLRGANFTDTNLMMANLDNADLSGANMQGAKVAASQLVNAIIDETTTLPVTMRKPIGNTRSFGKHGLRILPSIIDVNSNESDMFSGLIIGGRLAVSNGDFNSALLPKRNLIKSLISKTSFTDSDLDGAHLMKSDISESAFIGVGLRGADLSSSTLANVEFRDSDLRSSNFDGVNAVGPIDFQGSSVRRASFKGIGNGQMFIMSDADFRNTDFSGTDLSGAITTNNTNLDGAIFSSRKHIPKEHSGTPSVRLPASTNDTISTFRGTSLGELADFFEKVTAEGRYDLTYRGLTASEWNDQLKSIDAARVDLSDELSRLARKNSAMTREMEQLRRFPLPDGSVIDLFELTDTNSPDRLIEVLTEKAKSSDAIFDGSNPALLWKRTMSIRAMANYLELEQDSVAERNRLFTSVANTQKLIDAIFVNQRFMPLDNRRDDKGYLPAVEINDTDEPSTEQPLVGSKSTTSRIKQVTLSPEDMRLAATDLETYLLRFIQQAEVGWAPGHTQVPLVRMPRVPILMDALGLSPSEISAIETVAYPSKEDRLAIARAVAELLAANEYRVFGTQLYRDGELIEIPKPDILDYRKLRFDDSDIIDYVGVSFPRSSLGYLFGEGVELKSSDGQTILTFKADLDTDTEYGSPTSVLLDRFAEHFYGSSIDDMDRFDVLSVMMNEWTAILKQHFKRLDLQSLLRDESMRGASTNELMRRGLILDIADYIDFADNEIGQWYAAQMAKVTEVHTAKLRILSRSLEARDSLRRSVGVAPSMTAEEVKSVRENLYGVIQQLYPGRDDLKIFDMTTFMMEHLIFALMNEPSDYFTSGFFLGFLKNPDLFLHEMGHLVLGLGADRHGDFASNYAAFLSLGGNDAAHVFLNSFNSMQSNNNREWSIGEPYDRESRIPGNVISTSERETLPIIRVPLWAELPDATWGLPEGRPGSKSSTGPKPGMPESWDNLPENTRLQFERLLGPGNDEELIQELRDAVSDDGTGLSFIRHKFIHGLYIPVLDSFLNEQLRRKQAAAILARANKDWDTFVFLHERPYRAEAFEEIADDMSDDEYWSLLADVWIDSENIPEMRHIWDELLASPRSGRLSMMMDDERLEYDALPDTITVYQGHTEDRDDGWSWTTDPSIAQWFADRFANMEKSPGYVTTATVSKKDVHAFLTRRGESEILTDPETINIVSIDSVNDFSGGSKSSTAQPPAPQIQLEDVALINKTLSEIARNSPEQLSFTFANSQQYELKALALRIFQQMQITESSKHPHVPIISYGYISELTDQIGISDEDIRLLRRIEYLTPDERRAINDFVKQRRQEMDPIINGWSYEIYRDSDGDNVISFYDLDGKPIVSYRGSADLATWGLEPDFDDVDEYQDESPDERARYQGTTLYLEQNALANVYLNPYDDDSLTILIQKFMQSYNRARFADWQDQLVNGLLGRNESRAYFAQLFESNIEDVFDFGDSEAAGLVREKLILAKKAIDDSFNHLETFVNRFTAYLDKRDAIDVPEDKINEFRENQSRDAALADALFADLNASEPIGNIAANILPGLMRVMSAPNIDHIANLLYPEDLPGGWEHELGHIVAGLGATRHGDFASNYLIWMLHGYSPSGWLLTNFFNREQERQFKNYPNDPDVPHLEIPLWLDISPKMFGYPENPRAVVGESPLAGSKSSTAYNDGLRDFKRISADDYIDSFPDSGKAWLYPDGTMLPIKNHVDLWREDMGSPLDTRSDRPWVAVMDEGLVRIDISFNNRARGKPPYSLVADIGNRQLTPQQIDALRTILVQGGVPKMFFSVGGIDPARYFKGTVYVYNTGIDNLGRFLPAALAGLTKAPNSSVGNTNFPGSLNAWKWRQQ